MPPPLILAWSTLGFAAAALVWLATSRWRLVRRAAGLVVAGSAHAAAWVVLARVYEGVEVAWRGLSPGLLEASVVVFVQAAVLLTMLRAERLPGGAPTGAIVGGGVAASAVAYAVCSTSLVTWALLIPIPTVAAAIAAATDRGSRDLPGIGGLALADVFALLGLSAVLASSGSMVLGPAGGAGAGLLLAAAAIKAGAVPGIGTWRLAASGGGVAVAGIAVRGQAMGLAVLAGIVVGEASGHGAVAWLASVAVLAGGLATWLAPSRSISLAGLLGVGASLPFFALGLGGAVGLRAFLLLLPVVLLGSAAAMLALGPDSEHDADHEPDPQGPGPDQEPRPGLRVTRWAGALGLVLAGGSLIGLPPGGGFPGAWLSLRLAGIRAEVDPAHLLLILPVALGVVAAGLGGAAVVRASRPRLLEAVPALVVGGFLVYLGTQPVRLGVGWYLRVERALSLPELLPTAGAPQIPGAGGEVLLASAVPAALLALLLLVWGRGHREADPGFVPVADTLPGAATRPGRWLGSARRWWQGQWERLGVAPALALLAQILALVLAFRLVLVGASQGFL